MKAADSELVRGLAGLLGQTVPSQTSVTGDGANSLADALAPRVGPTFRGINTKYREFYHSITRSNRGNVELTIRLDGLCGMVPSIAIEINLGERKPVGWKFL